MFWDRTPGLLHGFQFFLHCSMPGCFGVWCRAVQVMLSCYFRMMCPIHLHRHLLMMVFILSWWVRASNWWLEMVLGQKVYGMQRAWKGLSLSSSSIQSCIVRWREHSSGTTWVWCWCCTLWTFTHCSSFWMVEPGWVGFNFIACSSIISNSDS